MHSVQVRKQIVECAFLSLDLVANLNFSKIPNEAHKNPKQAIFVQNLTRS